MKYIVSLNFGESRYYVCFNQDGSYNESYSPVNASQFESKKEAINWAKNKTTFGEYAVAVPFDEEKQKFDSWVANGMIRRSFPAIDRNLSRKYNPEKDDKFAVLDWRYKYATKVNECQIHFEDYETWPELYGVFSHLWGVESYNDNTISFSICAARNSKFETFKTELDLVIDKVTHAKNENKVLRIFDHFCGEGGNFSYLVQQKNGKWAVTGSYSKYVENATLEECFKYIKKYRYYDHLDYDDEYDDD